MINAFKKYRVGRYSMLIVATASLFTILMIVRYRSGVHYAAVAVEIPAAVARSEGLQVWVISPFGTSRRLDRVPHVVNLYRSKDYVSGPVRAIHLTTDGVDTAGLSEVRVLLGSSRVGKTSSVLLREVAKSQFVGNSYDGRESRFFCQVGSSGSLIPIASQCFNWQGDVSFLLVCLVQSASLVVFFYSAGLVLFRCVKSSEVGCVPSQVFTGTTLSSLLWVTVSSMSIVMLLILIHQLFSETCRFVLVADAVEQLLGILLLVFATLFLTLVAQGRLDVALRSRREFWVFGGAGVFGLLLMRVAGSGHWPWFQAGDYARYWRFGGLMSTGEWSKIYDGFLGTEMMAVRAFLYSFPIRFLAGNSTGALFVVNSLLLVGAAMVLYQALWPLMGHRRALLGATLFSLHPDIFFGGHLCRHDNPAMLYFALLVLMVGRLLESVGDRSVNRLLNRRTILNVFGIGCLAGLLEAQRAYLPFLLVSLSICLAGAAILYFAESRSSGVPWTRALLRPICCGIFAVIITATSFTVNSLIVGYVREGLGRAEVPTNWQMLASMETVTDQSWLDFVPFSSLYTPQIPVEEQSDFLVRKLLFEKVQSGGRFWQSLIRKNAFVSESGMTVKMSGAATADEPFASIFNTPFISLKSTFGIGWDCLLLSLGIIRLAVCRCMPLNRMEWFPYVFASVFMVAILSLAENGPIYDMILVFPLSIAGSRVLGVGGSDVPISQDAAASSRKKIRGVFLHLVAFLRPGVLSLAVLISIQCFAGQIVSGRSVLTFASPVPASPVVNALGETERLASALVPALSGILRSGEFLSAGFDVSEKELASNTIRFFVSGDQRRKQLMDNFPFEGLPLIFSVSVDGEVAASGRLDELVRPPYIVRDYTRNGGKHRIELRLTATADIQQEELGNSSLLAVEYVH